MLKDLLQSVKDWASGLFVKKSGDTMTGALTTTGLTVKSGSNQSAGVKSDGEGGNVWWKSPDGSHNELDSYNNTNTRIFAQPKSGGTYSVIWSRTKNYNLDNFQTTLAVSSGNGTRTSSARSDSWCNYYKWGRVVVCNFWCAATAQVNTYSDSAVLFTGLPANVWVGAMPMKIDNLAATGMVSVDSRGQFRIAARETAIPANNTVTGSFVYISTS